MSLGIFVKLTILIVVGLMLSGEGKGQKHDGGVSSVDESVIRSAQPVGGNKTTDLSGNRNTLDETRKDGSLRTTRPPNTAEVPPSSAVKTAVQKRAAVLPKTKSKKGKKGKKKGKKNKKAKKSKKPKKTKKPKKNKKPKKIKKPKKPKKGTSIVEGTNLKEIQPEVTVEENSKEMGTKDIDPSLPLSVHAKKVVLKELPEELPEKSIVDTPSSEVTESPPYQQVIQRVAAEEDSKGKEPEKNSQENGQNPSEFSEKKQKLATPNIISLNSLERAPSRGAGIAPMTWKDFKNRTLSSYKYGFPPGTILKDLIPKDTYNAFWLTNIGKYADGCKDDACFWLKLYFNHVLQEKNSKSTGKVYAMTLEQLSAIYIFERCGRYKGKRPFCPSTCLAEPCTYVANTISKRCKSATNMYTNDFECECKVGFVWIQSDLKCEEMEETEVIDDASYAKLVDEVEEIKTEARTSKAGDVIGTILGVIMMAMMFTCCFVYIRGKRQLNDFRGDVESEKPLLDKSTSGHSGHNAINTDIQSHQTLNKSTSGHSGKSALNSGAQSQQILNRSTSGHSGHRALHADEHSQQVLNRSTSGHSGNRALNDEEHSQTLVEGIPAKSISQRSGVRHSQHSHQSHGPPPDYEQTTY